VQLSRNRVEALLVRAGLLRTLIAPAVYVVAIAVSFFRPELSLLLYALVPVLYILPGRVDVHWGKYRQAPGTPETPRSPGTPGAP
jgi:hypothetical protein